VPARFSRGVQPAA